MEEFNPIADCDTCIHVMYPNRNRPEHMCLADERCYERSMYKLDEEKKELWLQERIKNKVW